MIDYAGFDVILGMYQLNAFHVVIDCRRSTVFRISKHSEFEFLSDSKSLELIVYKEMPTGGVLTALEANEKPIPILYEYLDVLPKELTWLPPEMVVKVIHLIIQFQFIVKSDIFYIILFIYKGFLAYLFLKYLQIKIYSFKSSYL